MVAKERGSSVHFEHIKNFSNSVAHMFRQQKHEPTYLLPKKHRLKNKSVFSSSHDLQAVFESDQSRRTKRAVTENRNSWWEGVINLPIPITPISEYYKEIEKRLDAWRVEFEHLTGQSVRHVEVHLDEGYLDENQRPVYNAHAHVFACRLSMEKVNAKILNPSRATLSKLQDMTAEKLQMQRGETLESRSGKRGRKHTHHADFRATSEQQRVQRIEARNKIDSLKFELFNAETELKVQEHMAHQEAAKIEDTSFAKGYEQGYDDAMQSAVKNGSYGFLRGFLKGSKQAMQSDYQVLKILNELSVDLSTLAARAEDGGALVFEPLRLLASVLSKMHVNDQKEAAKNVLGYGKEEFEKIPAQLRGHIPFENDSDFSL